MLLYLGLPGPLDALLFLGIVLGLVCARPEAGLVAGPALWIMAWAWSWPAWAHAVAALLCAVGAAAALKRA
jgi:hypothetical protein